jgi:formylglycine-generating enzyme required for sulfatase activity
MGKGFFDRHRGADESPVVRVSWHDTQEFIEKLNGLGQGTYRLPTEAEWEYAARAGTETAYSWGDRIDCSRAMYSNNPGKSETCTDAAVARGFKPSMPAPVGQYSPNPWGLHDMHGNVWEWVADWYGEYDQMETVNPAGPHAGRHRVKRGGSWYKHGSSCRSANRAYGHPTNRLRTTGFRLVRVVRVAP